MSYLTALGCVLAIIAIVIVGGVIIAYLGKVIIGIFDADRTLDRKKEDDSEQEIVNIRDNVYNTYNQTQNKVETQPIESKPSKTFEDEDFNYAQDVDASVAKREREELEKEIKNSAPTSKPVDNSDDFFADYKKTLAKDEDPDDLDLMSMIDEISNDVIDDKREEDRQKEEQLSKSNSSMLNKYTIDDILADVEDDDEDEEVEVKPSANDESLEEMRSIKADIMTMLEELKGSKEDEAKVDENVEEMRNIKADIMNMLEEMRNGKEQEAVQEEKISEEVARRVDEKLSENLQVIEELKRALEEKEAEVETAKNEQAALEEKYNQINKEMVEQLQNQNREIETSIHTTMNESFDQIHELKLQLAELTKQLQEERSMNWKVVETAKVEPEKIVEVKEEKEAEVVDIVSPEVLEEIHEEQVVHQVEERLEETTIEVSELVKKVEEITNKQIVEQESAPEVVAMQYSTEQQYLNRIEVLEERLKLAKKDLKLNDKEYKPLEKVKRTLDRDKAKLRRKEAIAAKKKVALYGVNNYVDIDKEKAEKLAHELELLDGLRLSVSHCEEVMNNNKERYPILEHTHIILANNIKDLEADIAQLNKELQILRDKNED